MEQKSIQMLKARINNLELTHNNLTTLVVSIMSNLEKINKKVEAIGSNNNNSLNSVETDIQKLINTESTESDDRTRELLEELRKAQLNT
tara:strand:- start:107 stop:373 length:267 start_codon:yes stop_codon:yes gene_type:complete